MHQLVFGRHKNSCVADAARAANVFRAGERASRPRHLSVVSQSDIQLDRIADAHKEFFLCMIFSPADTMTT